LTDHQIMFKSIKYLHSKGPSWSWSYGSWISNYLYNQCLSPLMLRVGIPLRQMQGVIEATLCDQVCQWLAMIFPNSSMFYSHHNCNYTEFVYTVCNLVNNNLDFPRPKNHMSAMFFCCQHAKLNIS
jgi:hypothetical protein